MMHYDLIKTKLIFGILLFVSAGILFFTGCDDSGVIIEPKPPPPPSIVVRFYNLSSTYWFQGTSDTFHMAVNLDAGKIMTQDSTNKDMELLDNAGDTVNFYFRSGHLSVDSVGKQTRFKRIYASMNTAEFDSLSVIPDADNTLTPYDFTRDDTHGYGSWPFFTIGQTEKPVYGFYLQGRNFSGYYFLYGVFHVKRVERVYSPPSFESYGVKVTIDVKVNRTGYNNFLP